LIYAIIYLTIGLFFATAIKLVRFYEFNKYELVLLWIGWPFILLAMCLFGLAGVGDDERER